MEEVHIEGELSKFLNYIEGYKKRWYNLDNNFLTQKLKQTDKDYKYIINVANCTIKREKNQIKILFPNKKNFRFKFEDVQLQDKWYDAFLRAKKMKWFGHLVPPKTSEVDFNKELTQEEFELIEHFKAGKLEELEKENEIQKQQMNEENKEMETIKEEQGQQSIQMEKQESEIIKQQINEEKEEMETIKEEQGQQSIQMEKQQESEIIKQQQTDLLIQSYSPNIRTSAINLEQNAEYSLTEVWKLYNDFQQNLDKAPQELKGVSESSHQYLFNLLDLCHSLKICLAECLAFIQNRQQREKMRDIKTIRDLQEEEQISDAYDSDEEMSVDSQTSGSEGEQVLPKEEDKQQEIKQQEEQPKAKTRPSIIKRKRTLDWFRLTLPAVKDTKKTKTIWEHIRNTITQDFASINVPIHFNEPPSFLQRSVEDLEYYDLLEKAESVQQEHLRNAYVAVFAVTPYNSAQYRNYKPVQSVLGETFEVATENAKILCEQVCDNPSTSALHAETDFFQYQTQQTFRTNFGGLYLDIQPEGDTKLTLKNVSEEYTWNRLTISVFNLIIGTPFCDFHGEVQVLNKTTNWKSTIIFTKKDFTQRVRNYEISGQVTDPQGQVHGTFSGRWDQYIYYTPVNEDSIIL